MPDIRNIEKYTEQIAKKKRYHACVVTNYFGLMENLTAYVKYAKGSRVSMSEEQDKITLVCTSMNPDRDLLNKMLNSAKGFDGIFLHIDEDKFTLSSKIGSSYTNVLSYCDPRHLSIPDAYNIMIEQVKTQWVCCFCDDDYFYPEGLSKMIEEVHSGIVAGVAHFKFHVSGYIPKEDKRCFFGKKEYDLWEPSEVTSKILEKHNRLPAGSFFRKAAWKMAGGFQGDKFHDWNLWKRMAQVGVEFKYFDYIVYNMVRRENSAWIRQNRPIETPSIRDTH